MPQHTRMGNNIRSLRIKLIQQYLTRIQAHKHAPAQQKPTNSQRTDTLHLAVAIGEAFGGRLQRPRDRSQGEKIGDEIGQGMVRVCDQSLRVEDVTADELADGHGEVGDETDPGDPDAGVEGVAGGQIDVVVMVVVMALATVAAVASGLSRHERECCCCCCCDDGCMSRGE